MSDDPIEQRLQGRATQAAIFFVIALVWLCAIVGTLLGNLAVYILLFVVSSTLFAISLSGYLRLDRESEENDQGSR